MHCATRPARTLLFVLFLGLGIASPHFLTAHNLVNIALQAAVVTIIALGMTLLS